MNRLPTPLVANYGGDVFAFDDLEAMQADIEAFDASKIELFDATGRPLRAVVEGYKWHVDEYWTGDPDPDRLTDILRDYFSRLPAALAEFSARAVAATSLDDLLQLRIELSVAPDPGRWSKLFKRPWG
jgi:hypothetical protein